MLKTVGMLNIFVNKNIILTKFLKVVYILNNQISVALSHCMHAVV